MAGVAILEEALQAVPGKPVLHVLIELGHLGGRTGVRTRGAAIEVARAAARVDRLVVDGLAFYEGTVAEATTEEDLDAVTKLTLEVRQAVSDLVAEGLLDPGRGLIVSAGGSAYFDVVADELTRNWPDGIDPRIVLRSGAYVTHDNGLYERLSGYGRLGSAGKPRPAMHIWAQVSSCPESGVAIAGFGKRDAPFDAGMPTPSCIRRTDGTIQALNGWTVRQLNDHHAYSRASRALRRLRSATSSSWAYRIRVQPSIGGSSFRLSTTSSASSIVSRLFSSRSRARN